MSFRAINFGETECGKKIENSKKRFFWTFSIDGQEHTLELTASFFSGKKKVLLDGIQIYKEKNILNINFEFRHSVEDHNIRVTQDKLDFECYIDNQKFQDLMHRNPYNQDNKSKLIEDNKTADPFAEFTHCFQNSQAQPHNNHSDTFGDFSMDFTTTPKATEYKPVVNKPLPKPIESADLFDFSVNQPQGNDEFFTGQFQTNNNVILGGGKGMSSGNFSQQGWQQRKEEMKDVGFFGKVESVFKQIYSQIPSIGKNTPTQNSVDLL